MLIDPKTGDPTRVGIKRDGDRRIRVARRSGAEIDEA
jgi:large subunit ribosomal protein L24